MNIVLALIPLSCNYSWFDFCVSKAPLEVWLPNAWREFFWTAAVVLVTDVTTYNTYVLQSVEGNVSLPFGYSLGLNIVGAVTHTVISTGEWAIFLFTSDWKALQVIKLNEANTGLISLSLSVQLDGWRSGIYTDSQANWRTSQHLHLHQISGRIYGAAGGWRPQHRHCQTLHSWSQLERALPSE